MATQRLTIATFVGEAATAVFARVGSWRLTADPSGVDRFCIALRENGLSLPIVYFCEWVDRWLMGDLVHGPEGVEGRRFQMTCLSPDEALKWADSCGQQFAEQQWLAARLREAAAVWCGTARGAVVVVREVLGASATDDEVEASLTLVPKWLMVPGSSLEHGA